MTTFGGVEKDPEIASALDWLAQASGDQGAFWERLEVAQRVYRNVTALPQGLGRDPQWSDLGRDIVASFLAQPKSLLDSRRSYDFALISHATPWIKQLGVNLRVLDQISGAKERAARMLRQVTVLPDSALFELVIASNYAAQGFEVAFVEEEKGGGKTPDLRLEIPGIADRISVECKRLRRGSYELDEQIRHKTLFRLAADLIEKMRLSIHLDVTYTRELLEVPDDYLANHLHQALLRPLVMPGEYPWHDEYGYGSIKAADLPAVRRDTQNSSLYFGTKLARLLSGSIVREDGYHLVADAKPDDRDPRYIDTIYFGSVITWKCVAKSAIEKKARYVRAKLAEADGQLVGHGPSMVHIAMDAELQSDASDLRRERNGANIKSYAAESQLMVVYLHYLVPRISEDHSWLIDETIDVFNCGDEPAPFLQAFPGSSTLENDLPAWRQTIVPKDQ